MDLLENPFYILGATSRDTNQRIMELADERSLLLDSNECMQARSALTTPRKRLSFELAWLPGISPKNANNVLSWLSKTVNKMPPANTLEALSPLARANIIASGLQRLAFYNEHNISVWIVALSQDFEDIDLDELYALINEERVVSGVPEITELSTVEAEIQERRRYYKQVIKAALDNLSPKELVKAVTTAVDAATGNGERQAPILIDDLVDMYEFEATGFLEKEEENIKLLVEKTRAAADAESPDSALAPMVNNLIQIVENWDTVAQPIQLSAKSRGLDHDASHRVAGLVRGLAIHMFNEHGKLDFSQQLTNMLQEVFAEVEEVAETSAKDTDALDEIAEQRARLIEDAKNHAEEWRREITYEAYIGAIFKDKLRISPEGIEWKGRHWDLDSITRVRWGGKIHLVNGAPTGTSYTITFGSHSDLSSIKLKDENTYSNFVDRLWKAVCVRLLTEYLEGLREGKKYRFGSAVMSDYGMELIRRNLFSSNQSVFCRWNELLVKNDQGALWIAKKADKKVAASFSYQDEDNIHLLEATIRMLRKKGGDRLSSLLG